MRIATLLLVGVLFWALFRVAADLALAASDAVNRRRRP